MITRWLLFIRIEDAPIIKNYDCPDGIHFYNRHRFRWSPWIISMDATLNATIWACSLTATRLLSWKSTSRHVPYVQRCQGKSPNTRMRFVRHSTGDPKPTQLRTPIENVCFAGC